MKKPKQIYFNHQPPTESPEKRIFIDSNIFLRVFLQGDVKQLSLKTNIEGFFRILRKKDIDLMTSIIVVQEVTFKIIDVLISSDLNDSKWILNKYKNDKTCIKPYLPIVERFYKWLNDFEIDICEFTSDDYALAKKLIPLYHLLPNDAYILAGAINHGDNTLATSDRDYSDVTELKAIYYPIASKL